MTRRCLVVHPGALGDVLLAGPALAHLARLGFRSTLAVASWLVALFRDSALVDQAQDLDRLGLHRLFVEPLEPDALERVAEWDAVVAWLGAGDPTFRASLARLGCPVVVARAAPAPGSGRHVARHLVDSLAPLGRLPADLPVARLSVAASERRAARAWLGDRGIGPAEAVVLQPGAGSAAKVWPGFSSLAKRLRRAGLPVVVLVGPADRAVAEALLANGAVDETALARDWPLPRIAALLSLARATVGNDSGPTHLAAAVGCPTVAVFGPTDPALWAPLGDHARVVATPADAVPWTAVDVARVEAALRDLLERRETSGPDAVPAAGRAWP